MRRDSHSVQIIDSLQTSIRHGCFVTDFIAQMKNLINQAQEAIDSEESKEQGRRTLFQLDLDLPGSNGFNCLHIACGSGNIQIVQYLLQTKRVNPNVKGTDEWTALEIAATNGVLESVHLLLRSPAIKIYCWSPRGSSLHLAAQIPNGFKICQTLLLENPKLLTVKD